MFIWRGWGILVPIIAFACSLIAESVTRDVASKEYWDTHSFPLSAALLLAGGLIWAIDAYLFRTPPRVFRDEQTGERVLVVPKHDFFFLRMKWWSLICVGFAIAIVIGRWTPG